MLPDTKERGEKNAYVFNLTIKMVAALVSPCISVFFAALSWKGRLVIFIKGSFVVVLKKR